MRSIMPRRPAPSLIASARRCWAMTPTPEASWRFPTASADGAGLARPHPGSPEIRLPRHAEGAVLAGIRSDRGRTGCGLRSFADTPRPIPLIKPVVDSISGFIAVMPGKPSAELELLAADCTRDFDPFRAPLTPEDRERRNPSKLTPRQREGLERWGYPYVMEDFRFHMTLTGRLPDGRREPILAMLRHRFSAIGLDTRRSTGSRCSVRTMRRRASGSSTTGNCAPAGEGSA